MTHTLVDQIVRNILKTDQPPVGTQPVDAISRPNYQRSKGQMRAASAKPAETTQTFSAKVDLNSQMASTSQAISQGTTNLPSGSLFALSLKPVVSASRIKQAIEVELPPVNSSTVQMQPSYQQSTTVKAQDSAVNVKMLGQARFIGTAAGHTLGYVIPNLDRGLIEALNTNTNYRAVGVISSRQGAAAQIMAVDEAVKKTNSKIIKLQLAKDDFGGTGHGVFILLGVEDVADVTQAVQIALNSVDQFQKNIVHNQGGKIETHFSARAAGALNIAFGAPVNKAFGIIIGAPAGVGLLMGDTALKTAPVTAVMLSSPSAEQAFANEVWLTVTGDSASIKNALEAAREAGTKALSEFRS